MSDGKNISEKVGEIPVFKEIITQGELDKCLDIQKKVQGRISIELGRIIVERFYASNQDILIALPAQQSMKVIIKGEETDIEVFKFLPSEHEKLMDIIRVKKKCTEEQIKECLDIQTELKNLGLNFDLIEILLLKKYIHRDASAQLSDTQYTMIKDPRRFAYRFGQIALLNNFVNWNRLDECIKLQKKLLKEGFEIRIGQLMIEKGYLSRSQAKAILQIHIYLGILEPKEARIEMVKLTSIENDEIIKKIKDKKMLSEEVIKEAEKMSENLKEFGIIKAPAEILLERADITPEPFADILEKTELLAKYLETRASTIRVYLPGENFPVKSQKLTDADYLFGRAAICHGPVSESQLEKCIDILQICHQHGMNFTLGQVMMNKFYEHQEIFKCLIEVQKKLKKLMDIDYQIQFPKFTTLEHKIVSVRVKDGELIPRDQLLKCYKIQVDLEQQGLSLDLIEILIAKGLLNPAVIADILEEQEERIRRLWGGWKDTSKETNPDVSKAKQEDRSEENETLLGKLAVNYGLLDSIQLSQALNIQMRLRQLGITKYLGEILINKGDITPQQIKSLLKLQKKMRREIYCAKEIEEELLSAEDRRLFDLLMNNKAVDKELLQECLYILSEMTGSGINASLSEILLEKGYIQQDVLSGKSEKAKESQSSEDKDKELCPKCKGEKIIIITVPCPICSKNEEK